MAKVGANPEVETQVTPNVEAEGQETQTEAKEAKKKEPKVLEPKAWQRVDDTDPNKPKLINQITFLGEKKDYEAGTKHTYIWNNLDTADGLSRVVTAKYPKSDSVDKVDNVDFMGYNLRLESYGNSLVCFLAGKIDGEDKIILEYVSLATVLDVLQDLLNPKDEDGKGMCNIPWNTIDQVIKKKRGLKSRIKTLGDNDLPAKSNRSKKEEEASTETTSEEQVGAEGEEADLSNT